MTTVLLGHQTRITSTNQLGFTLVELMVTASVLAILLGITAPNFTTWIERWRLDSAAADLESTLYFARAESIRRGGGISLIRAPGNGKSCTPSNNEWQCGWSLVIDSDQDGIADTGTTALQTAGARSNVVIRASADSDSIKIDRWGVMQLSGNSNAFNFTVEPASQSDVKGPKVCVKPGGSMQTTKPGANCTN